MFTFSQKQRSGQSGSRFPHREYFLSTMAGYNQTFEELFKLRTCVLKKIYVNLHDGMVPGVRVHLERELRRRQVDLQTALEEKAATDASVRLMVWILLFSNLHCIHCD